MGSIEAREIPHGEADVIVCEAFVGNVILKLYEGLAGTLVGAIKKGMMSTLRSKIGAALALPALKSKGSRDYQFHFSMCDVQRAGHQRKNQKKYYKFNGTGRNVKLWNLKN